MPAKFVPLNIKTTYSFFQSAFSVPKLIKALKKQDYFAAGISDESNMHAFPSFYTLAINQNIKPILGMEVKVEDLVFHFYIASELGYLNLLKIHTLDEEAKLDLSSLQDIVNDLIIVIEASKNLEEKLEDVNFLKTLAKISTSSKAFYFGVAIYSKDDEVLINKIRKFAHEHSYACLAFPLIIYEKSEDAISVEILNAIKNDEKLNIQELRGPYFFLDEAHLTLYKEEEVIATTNLVNLINFDLFKRRGELYKMSENSDELLKTICLDNLKKRNIDPNDERYLKRLNEELDVISKMGYSDYFLLVSDYVSYAKSHDITVGPGRGSSVGSLIAYLTFITEVDPLKFGLIFERFLNPARASMPDIDCDFADDKREEVIEYVRNKCGENKVAHIVAFQTIGAKQSLRDVGRVYEIDHRIIDTLSKLITNPRWSLGDAYRKNAQFKHYVDIDPTYFKVVSLAAKIEGLVRQTSLHASGIIINDKNLDEVMPIFKNEQDGAISEFDMQYLEKLGFLKMDFLGLSNLTSIDRILKLLKENENITLKFEDIPYDDEDSIALISKGLTMGLFQLESSQGMKNAIKTIKPKVFEDIVALLALYRPGPMDQISHYAKRKQGLEKITYIDDCLKPILSSTYGIIVYQEQVMQIAQAMAGFTLGEADSFRSAISKKIREKMESLHDSFIEGAIKNGHSKENASKVFDAISSFADYGFAKSHAVAYAMVATKMAYLKKHYPLYFYSVILDAKGAEVESKFIDYLQELKNLKIGLKNPDVNLSSDAFLPLDNALLFPLSAIKGFTSSSVRFILEERKMNGTFIDIYDFFKRMYPYKINQKEYVALIDGGALDHFNIKRETLRDKNNLEDLLRYASVAYDNDGSFLDLEPPILEDIALDNTLTLSREMDVLGTVLSGKFIASIKRENSYDNLSSIEEIKDRNKTYRLIALLSKKKVIRTKKNEMMAFLTLLDDTGQMEAILFPEAFNRYQLLLNQNNLLLIKGHLDERQSFVVEEMKEGR